MEKQFRHETPYGVVSETYDVDEKVIRDFTFYSNGTATYRQIVTDSKIINITRDHSGLPF